MEADGDEVAIQAAMALYRKQSPYGICVSMVMLQNRVNAADVAQTAVKALLDKWDVDGMPAFPTAEIRAAMEAT